MRDFSEFYGPNAGYVMELFERYQRDPASVDPETRAFFSASASRLPTAPGSEKTFGAPSDAVTRTSSPAASRSEASSPIIEASLEPEMARIARAAVLAQAIRERGHLEAKLDPLGRTPPGDPLLTRSSHGISATELAQLPARVIGGPASRGVSNALGAVHRLRQIYCSTTGYDFEHVHNPAERAWLRSAVENGTYSAWITSQDRKRVLDRLTQVELFEQFLHRTFIGQKRFSIEGADMLVPLLDEVIHCQTMRGNRKVFICMAHRGRLDVLAHVLKKPYEAIISEFLHTAQHAAHAASDASHEGWTGDVKYHLGARWPDEGTATVRVSITLAPNPSHLEFVNPVVEGMARAAQDRPAEHGETRQDLEAALAILIHGDAAFPGEGVVAETLNLSRLGGYGAGGAIHLILNNGIGFTTEPEEGRSTLYASDLAKGFEIPILHVNADSPEECLAAARLACAYRDRFHKDFLIDLIGYRRWGHNESDEPAFTQPILYTTIRSHPTIRNLFLQTLLDRGEITREEADGMARRAQMALDEARKRASETQTAPGEPEPGPETPEPHSAEPSPVSVNELVALNDQIQKVPDGFNLHPTLKRVLDRRAKAGENLERRDVEWAQAEALALATILEQGTAVRLTGQDVQRGTFSQRHLALHDTRSGEIYIPLRHLPGIQAPFSCYNSPLSEVAALGFEYGYSVQSSSTLVLWEAQFGDFANVAQVIIDQFIASGYAKWRQAPGLCLLLPHGYEGQGPEHSSARLERFLQLCADQNLRVANCSTAAQYYHLLRDQAAQLKGEPRPLVILTPKSLLRLASAAASFEDLAGGAFQPILTEISAPDQCERVLFCTGKVYHDLLVGLGGTIPPALGIIRIEELYPFPEREVAAVLADFRGLKAAYWVQEEPRNMGAWTSVQPQIQTALDSMGIGLSLKYVGRPPRASPAEGLADLHAAEQERIINEAIEGVKPAMSAPSPSGQNNASRNGQSQSDSVNLPAATVDESLVDPSRVTEEQRVRKEQLADKQASG